MFVPCIDSIMNLPLLMTNRMVFFCGSNDVFVKTDKTGLIIFGMIMNNFCKNIKGCLLIDAGNLKLWGDN